MVDFCETYSPFHVCLIIRPSAHLVYATSHLLQPLDVACFGPFERMYNNVYHKTMRLSPCYITRYSNLLNVISCAFYVTSFGRIKQIHIMLGPENDKQKVLFKNTSLETNFPLPFGLGNFSSLDWYFSQIPLPNMIYLYKTSRQ